MRAMNKAVERRSAAELLVTVNEAAFVSGITRKAVNQAIDRGEIHGRQLQRASDAGGRAIGVAELVYLLVADSFSTLVRPAIYTKLAGIVSNPDPEPLVIELENGVRLDISRCFAEVRARIAELARIKSHVEENPGIRGGEPVFRGTRIPVQMIASFVQQGVPAEEILEDYPALNAESLDIATRYVELYPRRGRPRQAPWRAQEPAHVIHPEDLRG
jgi:uncharacterized protein (DUF433 family)